jgi:hypothetical protein
VADASASHSLLSGLKAEAESAQASALSDLAKEVGEEVPDATTAEERGGKDAKKGGWLPWRK